MAWFKVDDSFYDHPKVFDAPDCAVALWVRAGSWASRNLTDGHVPAGMPRRLCDDPDTAVKELLKRGLWEHADDGGYRFHDWKEQQPLRERVLTDRAASNRRQALVRNPDLREFVRLRDASLCRYCGRPVEWKDRRSPSGGTFDHVSPDGPTDADNVVVACRGCSVGKANRSPEQAGMQLLTPPRRMETQDVSGYQLGSDLSRHAVPTRPDPTRPVLPTEVRKELDGASSAPPPDAASPKAQPKQPPKKGSRIPDDFKVTPEMVSWAKRECPDVDGRYETANFIDYWRAKAGKDGVKTDWVATWRTWMRRSQRQAGGAQHAAGSTRVGRIPADERCPKHRGNRKDNCGACRADQIAARRTA